MRLNTIFKYHFSFEYWVLTADLDGNTNYTLKSEGRGMVLPSGPGGLALITDEQLAIPMQVRSIRDRSDSLVTQVDGVGYPMYVTAAEPQLDPFSRVVAWKHTLRREPPRDYLELIGAAVG